MPILKTAVMFVCLGLAFAAEARAEEPKAKDLKNLAETARTGATAALRAEAVKRLGEIGPEAAPALKAALADASNRVRVEAANSLDRIQASVPSEVAPALAPALQDADRNLRRSATEALLRLGFADAGSRPVLLGALSQEDPEVRMRIMTGFWKSRFRGDEPYADEMLGALIARATTDQDPRVRRVAIIGMRSMRPTPPSLAQALLGLLADAEMAEMAAGTIDAMPDDELGQAAATRLTETLKSDTPAARALAARTLADLTGAREQATPLLKTALASDPDPEVRAAAAQTLGTVDVDIAVDPLLSALKTDASPKVKAAACVALSRFSPSLLGEKIEPVLGALDAAAKSTDESVKAAASMAALALRE